MVNLSGFLNRDMDSLQLQQQFYNDEDMSGLEVDELVMNGSNGFDDKPFGYEDDFNQSQSGSNGPRAVHQCNICNKIFVSFKGLQQHAIIHTDQKPFTCEICSKSFRFKSNLFEHRSVHSGFTPHACPYCGKTCRLKGNLKKHLKTHVSTKEELDAAWKPFASNRRPPAEVPHDAIIVRSAGEPTFTPPSRPRKRKLGLGNDSRGWIEKIRRGDILPLAPIEEKLTVFIDMLKKVEASGGTFKDCMNKAKNIAFERYECPVCKNFFNSRMDCMEHLDQEHPLARVEKPMFCEICLKAFADKKAIEQHESYHRQIQVLVETGELELQDPEYLVPSIGNEPDPGFGDSMMADSVMDHQDHGSLY